MIRRATSSGVPLSTMAVLMLSLFKVSMGFGVIIAASRCRADA